MSSDGGQVVVILGQKAGIWKNILMKYAQQTGMK